MGLYIYFIVKIWGASGKPPTFDSTLISGAAALAGVLGSAFALEVGTTTDPNSTNQGLATAIRDAKCERLPLGVRLRQVFSFEPSSTDTASWPKTLGIWAYAVVASAVAITYVLNQNQTPSAIKALAVAFGGYVIALLNAAYKSA